MPTVTRALYAISALLVAVGFAAWLAPVRETLPAAGAAAAPADGGIPPAGVAAATSLPADESFALVVDSNMFSPERVPPRVKFAIAPAAQAPPPMRRTPSAPRVYGITLRSGDPTALIDADPAIPGAEIYRVGDSIGSALIVEINDSTVVLDGPAGRRVLRLEPRAKP